MKKVRVPSPVEHPAAATALSVGGIASLLVIEAKQRLGVDVSIDEATLIVVGVIALYHFAQGKVKHVRN